MTSGDAFVLSCATVFIEKGQPPEFAIEFCRRAVERARAAVPTGHAPRWVQVWWYEMSGQTLPIEKCRDFAMHLATRIKE